MAESIKLAKAVWNNGEPDVPKDINPPVSSDVRKKMGWTTTPPYTRIVTAQMYYHNLTDIKDKHFMTKVGVDGERSNARLRSGLFGHIVNQRRDYVLAKPYSCDKPQIKKQFTMYELRRAATDYVTCGVMVVGLDKEGKFRRYPPESVDLDGNWVGVDAIKPLLRLEDGTATGIEPWQTDEVERPQWYTRIDSDEPALFDTIRPYIDAYELLWSRKQDALADAPNAPFKIKGYLDDPDKLISRWREDNIICIATDGDCEQMAVETDFTMADKQLEMLHDAIYDIGCAVDMAKAVIGNTSSVALRLLYVDLENKSHQLCDTLMEAIRRTLEVNPIGMSEKEIEELEINWGLNTIVNENDAIMNCTQAQNLVSTRTMLANMPWVKDVEKELDLLASEAIFADESSIDNSQNIRLAARSIRMSQQQRNNREDVSRLIQKFVRSDFANAGENGEKSGGSGNPASGHVDNAHR